MNTEERIEVERKLQESATRATESLRGPLPERAAPEDKLSRYRSEFGDRP